MRVHGIAGLLVLLTFSHVAFAECPKSASLGYVDGALDFCAQIDPKSAPQYMEFKRHVLQGAPSKEVNAAEGSKEFRQAYDAIRDALEKVPRVQAIAACSSTIGSKK